MERTWSLSSIVEDEHPWSTFVVTCETCHQILLYDNPGDQLDNDEFQFADLAYPKSGQVHRSVPTRVAKIYDEAFRVMNVAPNAFAVQIRKALEAICEDRSASGNNLQAKLRHLADRGEIPPVLAEASDFLRLLGNIGAHDINDSIHPLQVFAINDFFRTIVEYLYVAPSKLEEFKARLERTTAKTDRKQ